MGNSGDDFGTIPPFFLWFFGFVIVMMVCIVAAGVVAAVRNRRVLREAGLDPLAVDSQLAVRLMRSQALAEPSASKSVSSRLAELDELRNRGLITSEEYATRRAEIIADI